MKDSLGNRMKNYYEKRSQTYLTKRTPVILRLDGKSFHTFTRKFDKPFSELLHYCLTYATSELCKEINGAKLAYIQSDEISILIKDFDTIKTEAWFDYNVQKLTSVSASIMTAEFNKQYIMSFAPNINAENIFEIPFATFDARVFNIPESDVDNYFIWRQKDWERNSIHMLTRSLYSHKELIGKSVPEMHEMLHKKNTNWAQLKPHWKNGTTLIYSENKKWHSIFPTFAKSRNLFEQILKTKD